MGPVHSDSLTRLCSCVLWPGMALGGLPRPPAGQVSLEARRLLLWLPWRRRGNPGDGPLSLGSLECFKGRGHHPGSIDLKGLIMQRWGSAAWDGEPFRRHKMALRDCSATFHFHLVPSMSTWTLPPESSESMRKCCRLVATSCNNSFNTCAQGN